MVGVDIVFGVRPWKIDIVLVFDVSHEDMVKSTLCLVFDGELSKMGQRPN